METKREEGNGEKEAGNTNEIKEQKRKSKREYEEQSDSRREKQRDTRMDEGGLMNNGKQRRRK
jgi:hypothetical protein